MRLLAYVAVAAALAGCAGEEINAGNNGDAGSKAVNLQDTDGGTVLASHIQMPPTNIVSDGTTLFWSADTGAVFSMPVTGGSIKSLITANVAVFAVDDTSLYLVAASPQNPQYPLVVVDPLTGCASAIARCASFEPGLVNRIPKDGGTPEVLYNGGDEFTYFVGPTLLGAHVYWGEYELYPDEIEHDILLQVKTMPLHGGPASVAYQFKIDHPEKIVGLAVSSIAPFFLPNDAPDVDAGGFQTRTWMAPPGPDAASLDLNGLPIPPMPVPFCGDALRSDTEAVFCGGPDGIFRMTPLQGEGLPVGTTPIGNVVGDQFVPGGLVLDGDDVYWTDNTIVGSITKVKKTGGPPTVVAWDTNPIALAVDAKNVYWSDIDGHIMSIAK